MKDLVKGAEMRRNKGLEEGRKRKDRKDNVSGLSSQDYNQSKPKRTSEAIAEMVGTSPSSVGRFKKIRKESPEIYEEVVSGEKPILTAYKELPSVSGVSYESRKKNKDIPKEEAQKKIVTPMPDFGKSDKEMQQEADYENLKSHLEQALAMKVFIEDFQGAARTLLKKDKKLLFYDN